jgi:AraC-like DNA-binding protein
MPNTLHQFSIETNDGDELSEYFSSRVSKVSVTPTSKSKSLTASATTASFGDVVVCESAAPLGAEFYQGEDLDGYFLELPTTGHVHRKRGGDEIAYGGNIGWIGRLYDGDQVSCSRDWSSRFVRIGSQQITRALTQLLDKPLIKPLEFEPTFELAQSHVQEITSIMQLATTPVSGRTLLSSSPLAGAQFSELMTTFIVENFQHNYSEALAQGRFTPMPKHVKRAIDFMQANAARAITLQEIAAAACTSVRTLHYSFKQFLGVSPFEHLRHLRLAAAHADLLADPHATIADIGRRWGFPNPGRFATYCRQSYGQTPADIRRSARIG